MKITLEHEGITATVESDEVQITDVITHIVAPALLALGFHQKSVEMGFTEWLAEYGEYE